MKKRKNQISQSLARLIVQQNHHSRYFERAVRNLEIVSQEEKTSSLFDDIMITNQPRFWPSMQ